MSAEAWSRTRRRRRRQGRPILLIALAAMAAAVALLALVAGRTGDEGAEGRRQAAPAPSRSSDEAVVARRPVVLPPPPPFEPNAAEPYPNAKRLAGRALQRLATYPPGTRPAQAAAAAGLVPGDAARLEAAARTLVRPTVRSTGEVLYAQFGGLTPTRASVLVLLRQRTASAGRRSAMTRTIDVRLRLVSSRWRLEGVASLGGSPVRRPANLPPAARRVLANPRIRLPDSARWDIYRGRVDTSLLATLDGAARSSTLAVAVLKSGHSVEVFGTKRRSAHTDGYAADIWAVDGSSVVRQRAPGSPAHRLARRLYDAESYQLGSPWVFPGPRTSFTDAVHQDHLHVQRRAVPGARTQLGEATPGVRPGSGGDTGA